MKDIKINNIYLDELFIEEYEKAPHQIQKRMDSLIRMIDIAGKLPSSMHPHISPIAGVWVGVVSKKLGGWRVHFTSDLTDSGTIYLERLLSHEDSDRILSCDH
jgi:hypothetical protein